MAGQEQRDTDTAGVGRFLDRAIDELAGEMAERVRNRIWEQIEEKNLGHRHLDIVFDHDPCSPEGHFVEVESPAGTGVKVGEWIDRGDGYWALRLTLADFLWIESPQKPQPKAETSNLKDGYIGDSITAQERSDGSVYLTQSQTEQGPHFTVRMDPLVIAHFLGWLEDTELFKSIPRGFSNLIPEETEK